MEEILTEELLSELLASDSVESYLENNAIPNRTFSNYLGELLEAHDLKKGDVIARGQLNPTFAYELFNGTKTRPGRNIVLQMAFGMRLPLQETQRLLKHAGVSELYSKSRRDAIIIYCVSKGRSLDETNAELYRFEQETITQA